MKPHYYRRDGYWIVLFPQGMVMYASGQFEPPLSLRELRVRWKMKYYHMDEGDARKAENS